MPHTVPPCDGLVAETDAMKQMTDELGNDAVGALTRHRGDRHAVRYSSDLCVISDKNSLARDFPLRGCLTIG